MSLPEVCLAAGPDPVLVGGPWVAELEGVEVRLGRTVVLRDLELRLAAGQVVGITGGNGTGKSTLLAVLATVLLPRRGTVALFDHATGRGVPDAVRRRIALVAHQPALHEHRTLTEELHLFAAIHGRAPRPVGQALELVGLAAAARRRVRDCSQGMRRRADLARAWMCAPDLLLLDEPEAGLDADAAAVVAAMLADVRARGGAAVVVGHDRARLDQLTDRGVATLSGGRLRDGMPP